MIRLAPLLLLLCGCWPPATNLSEVMAREVPVSTRYKFIRRDDETARIIFWHHWGSTTTFDLAWPVDAGVDIDGIKLVTTDGSNPVVVREKYLFNGR